MSDFGNMGQHQTQHSSLGSPRTQAQKTQQLVDVFSHIKNGLTKGLAEMFLEEEAKTLEDRYRPQINQIEDCQTEDDITHHCRKFNNLLNLNE